MCIPELIRYKSETLTFPTSEIFGALKNQLENKWGNSLADTDSVSGEQNLCFVER